MVVEREVLVMVEQFCILMAMVATTQIYTQDCACTHTPRNTCKLVKSEQVLDCTNVNFLAIVLLLLCVLYCVLQDDATGRRLPAYDLSVGVLLFFYF